jgi:hypothetical protein
MGYEHLTVGELEVLIAKNDDETAKKLARLAEIEAQEMREQIERHRMTALGVRAMPSVRQPRQIPLSTAPMANVPRRLVGAGREAYLDEQAKARAAQPAQQPVPRALPVGPSAFPRVVNPASPTTIAPATAEFSATLKQLTSYDAVRDGSYGQHRDQIHAMLGKTAQAPARFGSSATGLYLNDNNGIEPNQPHPFAGGAASQRRAPQGSLRVPHGIPTPPASMALVEKWKRTRDLKRGK